LFLSSIDGYICVSHNYNQFRKEVERQVKVEGITLPQIGQVSSNERVEVMQ